MENASTNVNLPTGFRFYPTDEELIGHYLKKNVSCPWDPEVCIMADIEIFKLDPWELPGKALFGENEWFFFSPRDRKYPKGARPNRAAPSGYWKATGTDRPILTSIGSHSLGVKTALVFYKGRPPAGLKTKWTMLEYRLLDGSCQPHRPKGSMRLDDWVLCGVRQNKKTPLATENVFTTPSPLQTQKIVKNKHGSIPAEYNYDFEAYPMDFDHQIETSDECKQSQYFQNIPTEDSITIAKSPTNSSTSSSSLNEALESIKAALFL